MTETWRTIPGYGGWYEMNAFGDVRSWYVPGTREKERDRVPHLLTPYLYHRPKKGATYTVSLTTTDGKSVRAAVRTLMRDTWMKGPIPGMIVKSRNEDPTDCSINNLFYATRAEANRRSPRNRQPVAKVSAAGEVAALYPSIAEAARKNHLSHGGIAHRITRKTVVDGFCFRKER